MAVIRLDSPWVSREESCLLSLLVFSGGKERGLEGSVSQEIFGGRWEGREEPVTRVSGRRVCRFRWFFSQSFQACQRNSVVVDSLKSCCNDLNQKNVGCQIALVIFREYSFCSCGIVYLATGETLYFFSASRESLIGLGERKRQRKERAAPVRQVDRGKRRSRTEGKNGKCLLYKEKTGQVINRLLRLISKVSIAPYSFFV